MTVDSQDTAVFAAINTWLKLTNPTSIQTNTLRSALKTWVALVNPPSPSVPNVISETYTLAKGYGADALIGSIVTDIPATSFSIVSGNSNNYFNVWPSGHLRTSEAGPIPPPGTYNLTISASNANGTGASAVYSIVCQGPVVIPSSGFSDTNWPSITNRPTVSGLTLSWIGPLHGGPNNGNPVQQTRSLSASGAVTSSSNGQIIEGLDITGSVTIQNNNVVLRQCRIKQNSTNADTVQILNNVTGVVVEDCEIDGSKNTLQGISPDSFNLTGTIIRRNHIHGVENGISSLHDGTVITDNYFHAMGNAGNPSYDGDGIEIYATTANGVTVRHNTFDATNDQTSSVVYNSSINMTNTFGSLTNCIIDNNHFTGTDQPSFIICDDNTQAGGTFNPWVCTNNGFINCGGEIGPVSPGYRRDNVSLSTNSGNYYSTNINSNSGTLINAGTGAI